MLSIYSIVVVWVVGHNAYRGIFWDFETFKVEVLTISDVTHHGAGCRHYPTFLFSKNKASPVLVKRNLLHKSLSLGGREGAREGGWVQRSLARGSELRERGRSSGSSGSSGNRSIDLSENWEMPSFSPRRRRSRSHHFVRAIFYRTLKNYFPTLLICWVFSLGQGNQMRFLLFRGRGSHCSVLSSSLDLSNLG